MVAYSAIEMSICWPSPVSSACIRAFAGPDHRWPEMAAVMEREELADSRFASRNGRLINADEVDALMLPWLLDHDKVDIFKTGQNSCTASAHFPGYW